MSVLVTSYNRNALDTGWEYAGHYSLRYDEMDRMIFYEFFYFDQNDELTGDRGTYEYSEDSDCLELKSNYSYSDDTNTWNLTNRIFYFYNVLVSTQSPQRIPPLHISPNPSTDYIHISLDNQQLSTRAQLQVFNAQGQLLQSQSSKHDHIELNTTALAAGMYYLRLVEDGRLLGGGTFVKF
ncbi:MAG TPA: T9SS type A sorting domain-containing protein [Phaeodactylibacter sp.]|nr:T9SS type A sorting domain-containing protein [Phaeodactylibacter sp.]